MSYLWVSDSLSPTIMADKHYKFKTLTLDFRGVCEHTAHIAYTEHALAVPGQQAQREQRAPV